MNMLEDEIVRPVSMEEFEKVFTPQIKEVIGAVRKYGFDIRVVGGAVRDFLLGKVPRDVDFATDADPAELIFIFDLEDIKYDAGGIEHGTVKAVYGLEKIDVSTLGYSIDVVDDKMEIRRAQDWEQDAKNRDITINSMSLDMDGNIHDYVGSLSDLKQDTIRLNKTQYSKLQKHPELLMRWFKALTVFHNPRLPSKDLELIKNNLELLLRIRNSEKTKKTLLSIEMSENRDKIIALMCAIGAGKYLDIDCI